MTDKEWDIEKDGDYLAVSLSFLTGLAVEEIKPKILAFGRRCQSEAYEKSAKVCGDSAKLEPSRDGLYRYLVCTKTPYELRDEILALESGAEAKA